MGPNSTWLVSLQRVDIWTQGRENDMWLEGRGWSDASASHAPKDCGQMLGERHETDSLLLPQREPALPALWPQNSETTPLCHSSPSVCGTFFQRTQIELYLRRALWFSPTTFHTVFLPKLFGVPFLFIYAWRISQDHEDFSSAWR